MESAKTCLQKYIDFNGRASRSEYWWFVLLTIALSFIPVIGWILRLVLLLPSLAVQVRRLHDMNRSAWWLLLLLPVPPIIIIGAPVLLIMSAFPGTPGTPAPTAMAPIPCDRSRVWVATATTRTPAIPTLRHPQLEATPNPPTTLACRIPCRRRTPASGSSAPNAGCSCSRKRGSAPSAARLSDSLQGPAYSIVEKNGLEFHGVNLDLLPKVHSLQRPGATVGILVVLPVHFRHIGCLGNYATFASALQFLEWVFSLPCCCPPSR